MSDQDHTRLTIALFPFFIPIVVCIVLLPIFFFGNGPTYTWTPGFKATIAATLFVLVASLGGLGRLIRIQKDSPHEDLDQVGGEYSIAIYLAALVIWFIAHTHFKDP